MDTTYIGINLSIKTSIKWNSDRSKNVAFVPSLNEVSKTFET